MTTVKINIKENFSYKKLLQRLNRIAGQIEGVKKMIQEERYCPDILTQLHAARNAIKTIELGVLESHVDACITETCTNKDGVLRKKRISEIMELIKKYE